nr:MAG TPA: hypothetical protein [Caudoviricetes sp.]
MEKSCVVENLLTLTEKSTRKCCVIVVAARKIYDKEHTT